MTKRGLPRILVTAGPTREYLDPTRFISNPSGGKMGYLIAKEAQRKGFEVILVSGPTGLKAPPVRIIRVVSALEMNRVVQRHFPSCDVLVMTAAVADFRPRTFYRRKIKKINADRNIKLKLNPDILAWAGRHKGGRLLVGFSAETDRIIHHAESKLKNKKLDLIIANKIDYPGVGFEADSLKYVMLEPDKKPACLQVAKKNKVAKEIMAWILRKICP